MTSWSKSRFAFAAALVLSTLGFYAYLFHTAAFWRIGVPQMTPCFTDLRLLFAAADCARQGHNVFLQNPCDPGGFVYNYSTLFLNAMVAGGITQAQTEAGGAILVTTFVLVSGFILAPRNKIEFLVSLGVMMSPAVMLGTERANIDLLIMVGIAVAAVGAEIAGVSGWVLAAAGVIPGILIKYYPIFAVPALAAAAKKRDDRVLVVVFGLIVLGGYFLFFPVDIENLRLYSPVPDLYALSFGGMNLFKILGTAFPARGLAALCSLCVIFSAWILHKRFLFSSLSRTTGLLMLTGASVYLGCFFLNSNWEYRRLFLILVFPGLFELCSKAPRPVRMLGAASILLGLVLLWSTCWDRGLPRPTRVMSVVASRPIEILKELLDWSFVFLLTISAFFAVDSVSRAREHGAASYES